MNVPSFLRHLFHSIRFLLVLGFCTYMFPRVLFTPCKVHAQDTSYPAVDAQIPGPATPSNSEAWLADLRHQAAFFNGWWWWPVWPALALMLILGELALVIMGLDEFSNTRVRRSE